jgi:hypothetical protein
MKLVGRGVGVNLAIQGPCLEGGRAECRACHVSIHEGVRGYRDVRPDVYASRGRFWVLFPPYIISRKHRMKSGGGDDTYVFPHTRGLLLSSLTHR